MKKILALCLVIALAVTAIGGATLAYFTDNDDNATNTFTVGNVEIELTEPNWDASGTEDAPEVYPGEALAKDPTVENIGANPCFVRVRLVTYRVNDQGQRIGGEATIPAFNPGAGWVENGDYYYYTSPVAPGAQPAANLIDEIVLQAYTDADGGKQVIEVMAEAIQADGMINGEKAVVNAWGIDPETLA